MKILQITSSYPPSVGGVQNCVKEISERLFNNGNQVEVFTSDIGSKLHKNITTGKVMVHYMKGFRVANTNIIPFLFIKLLLRKFSKDTILHVHIAQAFVPEVTYLISLIRRVPYIAHYHTNVEASGKLGFLLGYYKKYILKRVLSKANRVICLNNYQKEFIILKFGISSDKIIIIPNGVSEEFFEKKELQKDKDVTRVLYVGRLSKEKNVDNLVNAILKTKNNIRFDIVGEGDQREVIENIIRMYGAKNIFLHGSIEHNKIRNFYKSANILLISSDYEGLPLSVLEAMAMGVSIIGAKVRGISELVENTGILVSPPTAENFAREIDRLIDNKEEMIKLSVLGNQKATRYDWEIICINITKIYEEVFNEYQ